MALSKAEVEPNVKTDPPPKVEPKPSVKKVTKAGQLVDCELVKGNWLYQSSTRRRIIRGEITPLKADGWLKLQIDAGLIKLVE